MQADSLVNEPWWLEPWDGKGDIETNIWKTSRLKSHGFLLGQTLAPNHLELFFVVLVGESSGRVGMKSWIFDPGSRTKIIGKVVNNWRKILGKKSG